MLNSDPIVIAGVGLVTPLGRSADATWQALLDGRHIADHCRVERVVRRELPRVSSLAVEAATEAVTQAGWDPSAATALVVSTSKGPVEEWMGPSDPTSDNVGGGADVAHPAFGMASVSADVVAMLRLGDGPRLTLSAACAGGLQALVRAALLIRSGEADRVLVVAAEASVHPMFVASFRRLGVLPPPGELCRPYDRDRQGFLMSEAAAAVCLSRDAGVGGVTLDRFATAADATHLTGVDRDGVTLRRLVAAVAAGLSFDLVHGHGTGTELNDAAELAAFAAGLPGGGAGAALYSHKGAIGHTLGASGLVSAVLNVLAHRHGVVPPNVNTRWPLQTACQLSNAAHRRPIGRSLTIAAGFGGGVTAVGLTTP